jgi:hypothetical protein
MDHNAAQANRLEVRSTQGLGGHAGGAPVPANPSESQKNGKARNREFKTHREANPKVREERNEFAEVYVLGPAIGLGQHADNGRGVPHSDHLEIRVGHSVRARIGGAGWNDGVSLCQEPKAEGARQRKHAAQERIHQAASASPYGQFLRRGTW